MANIFLLVLLLSLLAIPVGLIKPAFFQKIFKKLAGRDATRKNVFGSMASIALASFIGIGVTAPSPVSKSEDLEVAPVEEVQTIEVEEPILEKTIQSEITTESSAETDSLESVENIWQESKEPNMKVQPETTSPASNVETHSVTNAPEPVYEEPESTSWYSCSSDTYNCSSFSTHAEAQSVYEGCLTQVGYDVHGLDGNDNDGSACESLP